MKLVKACLIASATLFVVPSVLADPAPSPTAPPQATAKRDVATLLFDNSDWAKAPAGTTITYDYSKKTAQAAFGPSFDDHIVLKLDKGDKADSREVEVKMFSGANAKPAGPFPSEKQNPVLLLVMEENVQELSKLFKANPRYLKNAIRKAWRDDAKIIDTPVDFEGKQVPGTKITVTPFVNDAEKDKMMGLNGITYTIEISDSVPGEIVAIDIHAPVDGKPTFSETLHFKSAAQ